MKVLATTAWDVTPARVPDFLANCGRAAEIHRRLGAEAVHLIQSMAGPVPALTYAMVFPDGATYGAFIDAISADEEWLAFWAEASAGERYATMVSQSVGTDLFS